MTTAHQNLKVRALTANMNTLHLQAINTVPSENQVKESKEKGDQAAAEEFRQLHARGAFKLKKGKAGSNASFNPFRAFSILNGIFQFESNPFGLIPAQ
eukprot:14055022-Ditylum_brightwellii.AAC.1